MHNTNNGAKYIKECPYKEKSHLSLNSLFKINLTKLLIFKDLEIKWTNTIINIFHIGKEKMNR